ncbi:hypothetical protein D3C81_1298260 [compost metagenome]
MACAVVVPFKACLQLLGADLAWQQAQLQRDAQDDALTIGRITRHEHRPGCQAGMQLDFRYMLVRQLQAVHLQRGRLLRAGLLMAFDRRTATAGIAGDGMDAQRVVGG